MPTTIVSDNRRVTDSSIQHTLVMVQVVVVCCGILAIQPQVTFCRRWVDKILCLCISTGTTYPFIVGNESTNITLLSILNQKGASRESITSHF